jgi:hypothetical protein
VTGRCTGRCHGLTGRVRLVQRSSQAHGQGFATGTSGHSWDRSVRSSTQRNSGWRRAERTRSASGHTRSDASGREGCLLDSNRMLALSRPVVAWSASSRCIACAGTGRSVRPVITFDRWHAVTVGDRVVTVESGRPRGRGRAIVDEIWSAVHRGGCPWW